MTTPSNVRTMGERPGNDLRHTFPRDNVFSNVYGLLTPNGVLEDFSQYFPLAKMSVFKSGLSPNKRPIF